MTDALLSLPAVVLAIVMIVKLGTVTETQTWLGWLDRRWQITFTLGILAIAPLARIVRARTLALREADYVLAARSLGATSRWVVGREVLPNLVPTMLTVAVHRPRASSSPPRRALAFLGLSVEAPTPTWGKLIDENRNSMSEGWWATVFPCLMLFLTVLSFNLIGDWLARRARHPQSGDLDERRRAAAARGRATSSPTSAPRVGWSGPSTEVSLTVRQGEALGIVGESGSGKTVLSRSMMGLLSGPEVVRSGSVRLDGVRTRRAYRRASCAGHGAPTWRWSSRTRRAR